MTSLFVTSLFGAAAWIFIIADIIRGRCVPGTRRRYLLATIEWTLVPFMATQPLWLALAGAPKWLWIFCTIGNYACIYFLIRDDDDNYWKRKKTQLKTWIRNLSRKPATAGAAP